MTISGVGDVKTYQADFSSLSEVKQLALSVAERHNKLDMFINNAGNFKTHNPLTDDGHDVRFIVNTVAPYLLTQALLPCMSQTGRVVNLSSAAQASVDLDAFNGTRSLSDGDAYAQSRLGITMWSVYLSTALGSNAPSFIAVNPASFLGSKMVKEAYGMQGHDLGIGADIIKRASLSPEFESASGRYYDNDKKGFAQPHPDALDNEKNKLLVDANEELIRKFIS